MYSIFFSSTRSPGLLAGQKSFAAFSFSLHSSFTQRLSDEKNPQVMDENECEKLSMELKICFSSFLHSHPLHSQRMAIFVLVRAVGDSGHVVQRTRNNNMWNLCSLRNICRAEGKLCRFCFHSTHPWGKNVRSRR